VVVAIFDWKDIYIYTFFSFKKNYDMWHFVRLPCVLMDLRLCLLQL
jgi:hypothetical protein